MPQLGRGRTGRGRFIIETRQQTIDSNAIAIGGLLLFGSDRDCLQEVIDVVLCFQELSSRRCFWNVEVASRACHPMRAPVEELEAAPTMSEIIVKPGDTLLRIFHLIAVDQNFDHASVALEIPCVGIRLGQLRRRDLHVMLRRMRRPMAKPLLKFRERHRFFTVEQLAGNGGPCAMTGEFAPNIMIGDAGLST
ncbi:MAG: hypothetical protein BGP17_04205 [Sphingomonas sp. 67-41]|nr:MAG: hypothetical protein BGP17_04205 [Sphingomonas sp. 67-41]